MLAAPASPLWMPHVHEGRRPRLLARNRVRDALRRWLAEDGFCEVDPAVLQVSPGNEAHIAGFATQFVTGDGPAQPLYLHSSPEFACKKLLAAGEERIYSLGHVFRNRERGPLHHPEFTMLEWYRAGRPYSALMADCAAMLAVAARAAGVEQLLFRGLEADPFAEPERLSVVDAFARHAGVDLAALLPEAGGADQRGAFAAAAGKAGVRVTPDDTWSDIFSKVLSQCIEPHLGMGRATLLMDYPVCEAALARAKPEDARFAERFELYACGVELANGFGELINAKEQRHRFELEMAEKLRIYGETYPLDEDFLDCLAHMPEASGCALGFDRLVMLVTGAARIDDVLWAPVAEAAR